MGVFDLDSMQLIRTVRDMRDEGKIIGGEDIQVPPKMFIGAAANPFADPVNWRVVRLAKKVDAGVDFIQTQCIFNVDRFTTYMQQARDMGLTEKGAHSCRGYAVQEYRDGTGTWPPVLRESMCRNTLIDRMAGVPKDKQAEEGIKIAVETIQQCQRH